MTKPLVVDRVDSLCMWFSDDRRVVMYPCNNNDTLNFVLIHPADQSHASPSDGTFVPFDLLIYGRFRILERVCC